VIPREYVDNYTKALNVISEQSRAGLRAALEAVDYTQDVATIREQVDAIMQTWCGGSTDMAATLAAEFYDGIREYELGERMGAMALSGRNAEATSGAVRAFAQKLVEGKVEQFINLCLDRLDYENKVAAATTVIGNGRRDTKKPKYARVPTGVETCDFCLMLASRGFAYQSEEMASHAHSGCDCRTVPSWKSFEVDGYDPTALYHQWQDRIDQMAEERAERNGTTPDQERRNIMAVYQRAASNAKKRRRP
jgi:hypothetical protein